MSLGVLTLPKGTRANADLAFLSAIERGEVITQEMLKQRIGVSVGLINALLKRAIAKGLVKARQAPYKRYAYYLTPKGFAEKSRLVTKYLESSLDLFRQARDQYSDIFRNIRRRGMKRVVLVGGGELTEIALLAAISEDIEILAIVDPGAKAAKQFGIPIAHNLGTLASIDAAIVTDLATPQETYERLQEHLSADRIFAPAILLITPDRKGLLADGNARGEIRL